MLKSSDMLRLLAILIACPFDRSLVSAFVLHPPACIRLTCPTKFGNSLGDRHRRTTVTRSRHYQLHASSDNDEEIERLRSMAAKLRAEAAALEAEKAQALADAAEQAFRRFDVDKDGLISSSELKRGLEKDLKTELSEKRVQELMKEFDSSGDGNLQLEEFVGIDMFRNRLEALVREEKQNAADAKKKAKMEEEAATLAMARLELINDTEPTTVEKVLSIIPYLFPLLDGFQFARFLILSQDGSSVVNSNPFLIGLALLYALYRSIPFSGFIAFFALNFLSFNPRINRLIRFNMQQAIFLDIALFFPGLLFGLTSLLSGIGVVQIPSAVEVIFDDLVFATLVLSLVYCTISSLLGITPDKLPIISKAASDRMPSADMFTIDQDGKIIPKSDKEDTDEGNGKSTKK